jgi:F-type H+-transporting ATPase subunit gamma
MASLKDTKRRIGSVKNTQKITRAMKLVSAAKFARANVAAVNSRPYGDAFDRMVRQLSSVSNSQSPLLERREVKKALLIVMTSDKGLCGGLNSNLIKKCTVFAQKQADLGVDLEMIQWGKRGSALARNLGLKVNDTLEKVLEKPSYQTAAKSAEDFSEQFISEEYDAVYAAYPKFVNALTQSPEVVELLPFGIDEDESADDRVFVFEPSSDQLLDSLLKKQVANKLYRMMLEGSASEHAARMTAMDNATNNAEEVVKKLTLDYNRARQAAITKELIEITSGAEAL